MTAIAFGALAASFLDQLAQRNYQPNTIKGHRSRLRALGSYLEGVGMGDVRAVARETLWDYANLVMGRAQATHTKALKLGTVRLFFRWLKRRELILVDPSTVLPRLKQPSRLPREVLSRDEANLILAQPDLGSLAGFRDRTMLEVLYSTGMRASELLALAVPDVDLSGGLVRINLGKGRKDRIVPLGRVAVNFAREYLRGVRPRFTYDRSAAGPLFLAWSGKGIAYNTFAQLVRTYARGAGLEKRVTAQVFRHTCATEMLRGGSSIRHVQEMLGHACVSTTQVYTRVLALDLVKTHAKHHPLAKRAATVPVPPGPGAVFNRR